MGQDPDMIRRDIEDTRERMGETVDALGYKTDVKSRAKESVTEKVDTVKEKLVGAKDTAQEQGREHASQLQDSAQESAQEIREGARS